MAQMQFYHKNCLKLRNEKIDARISKENVSIRDLNFIHSPIWFLHIILWVVPFNLHKRQGQIDHLTLTYFMKLKIILSNKCWYAWVANATGLKSIELSPRLLQVLRPFGYVLELWVLILIYPEGLDSNLRVLVLRSEFFFLELGS